MKVKATNKGVYGSVRRKIGEVFDVAREDHVDTTWMERIAEPAAAPAQSRRTQKAAVAVDEPVVTGEFDGDM